MFHLSDIRDCVTLDFETERIENRPHYPPKPVGLAVRYPSGDSEYFAWDHPTDNNTTRDNVRWFLIDEVWHSDVPILFFNAKFDLAVAY